MATKSDNNNNNNNKTKKLITVLHITDDKDMYTRKPLLFCVFIYLQ